jgi:hypothetical protein
LNIFLAASCFKHFAALYPSLRVVRPSLLFQ